MIFRRMLLWQQQMIDLMNDGIARQVVGAEYGSSARITGTG
jgi:hypothetical protein